MHALSRTKILALLTVAFFIVGSFNSICKAQALEEPQILVLTPNSISYDPSFEPEIKKQSQAIRKQVESNPIGAMINSPEYQKLSEHKKRFFRDFKTLYEHLDFFKNIALGAGNYLSYTFAQLFPNPVITMKDLHSNGAIAELAAIYDSVGLQYIVNFPSVAIYRDSGKSFAKLTMQLYDGQTGSIAFTKEYIGDWSNPGFTFSCEDSTISCTINNALSQALSDIVRTVSFHSPTLRQEKAMQQERYLLVINRYYSAPFDETIIKTAIPVTDNTVDQSLLFQCLYDQSHTKFVGFYSTRMAKQDFAARQKNKADRSVNIKVDHDISDPAFFEDMPQTYAYLVCGIRQQGKWFYKKTDVTYFNPKDSFQGKLEYFNSMLQDHHFFKAQSSEENPEFWETDLFAKIPDLRKDPDWKKYGNTIWKNDERENKPYIGMYELVADELRAQRKEAFVRGDTLIKESVFLPFYRKLRTSLGADYTLATQVNSNLVFIYPADRSIILNPVVFKDRKGQTVLRYFVYIPSEKNIYEWTYLPPAILDSSAWFATQIISNLKNVVDWNYSYSSLDNKEFWEAYVLKREGKNYKYLRPVK